MSATRYWSEFKFLAIISSNLDEFFMVRVAGLRKQVDVGVIDLPPDGMSPPTRLLKFANFPCN